MNATLRLGVFGGTFDPPHYGHVMACLYALECGTIDRLHVVPTARHPWGKQPTHSFADRLEMCRLALRRLGGDVVVDAREGERDGPSYMIDTLESLAADFPGASLRLVVGTDVASTVAQWHRGEELLRRAPLLVVPRLDATRPLADQVGALPLLSSSDVREALRSGRGIEALVPAPVREFLNRKR